jgi:hypothetical protein
MIRTAITRKAPLPRQAAPAVGKPRQKSCKVCRARFEPRMPLQVACGLACAAEHGKKVTAQQKAKAKKTERAQDRQAKRELMSPAKLAEPVRKLAQKYAVLRDREYGCISCDKGPHWHGVWHGSHFKSVGSNSALQFNLWNINKACDQCNYFLAGNIGPYETRLRQKYGDERVDWLKNHPRSREYSIEYLDRLSAILRKKIRRITK